MPPGHSALYMLIPVSHQHPNVDWSKEGSQKRVLRSGRADASLREAMPVNSTQRWTRRRTRDIQQPEGTA